MGLKDFIGNVRSGLTKRSDSALGMWLKDEVIVPAGYRHLVDCPEVVSAANVYADLISVMTIHLMENGKLGDERIVNGLSRLVDIRPNPYMNKGTFYQFIVRNLLLGDGNQVTVPVFTSEGEIEKLVPLSGDRVSLVAKSDGYRIKIDNSLIKDHDEVLHFRLNPDLDQPWRGTGFKFLLKDVLEGLSQAKATKNSMMRQPVPSIIIGIDSDAAELSSEEGRRKFSDRFVDRKSQGLPWFIPADMMNVTQVRPLSLRDLAVKEGLELDKTAVATLFGIPPFLLGVGNFSKDEYNNFIRTRLRPIAKMIEEELTRKLLISDKWYFKMNYRSLMAYDSAEIVDIGQAMVDRTAMTRNEWRDMLGYSPREDMEELIILENYLPIDKIGDQKKLVGNDKEDEDEQSKD